MGLWTTTLAPALIPSTPSLPPPRATICIARGQPIDPFHLPYPPPPISPLTVICMTA